MYEKSITLLNKAVGEEMTALNQYMYFHFHCDDQGFDLLANLFKRSAIDEMRHAERLAERILFLKGEVELKASDAVHKTHKVKDMLEMASKMETKAIQDYNKWANECAQNADSVTKKLFEEQGYNNIWKRFSKRYGGNFQWRRHIAQSVYIYRYGTVDEHGAYSRCFQRSERAADEKYYVGESGLRLEC